jgi:hypothetical protein
MALAMGYLLLVGGLPVVGVGGAVALLASALRTGTQPEPLRVLGAGTLLLVPGVWIFLTTAGGGYSLLAAAHELIFASAAALVGAVVLIRKPPRARRVVAILLMTAYPLMLVGLAQAGSMLTPDSRFVVIKTPANR